MQSACSRQRAAEDASCWRWTCECKSRSAQLWTKTDGFITPPVNRIRSGGLPAHLPGHPSFFSSARPSRRVARSYIIRTLTACEEESYCQGSVRAISHARLRFYRCAETLLAFLVSASLWVGIAASRQKVGLSLCQLQLLSYSHYNKLENL